MQKKAKTPESLKLLKNIIFANLHIYQSLKLPNIIF